jgi:hypothetical protein
LDRGLRDVVKIPFAHLIGLVHLFPEGEIAFLIGRGWRLPFVGGDEFLRFGDEVEEAVDVVVKRSA